MADISSIKPTGASGIEYNIKDTTARSGLDSKVNKSGDTMTGNLTVNGIIQQVHERVSSDPGYGIPIFDTIGYNISLADLRNFLIRKKSGIFNAYISDDSSWETIFWSVSSNTHGLGSYLRFRHGDRQGRMYFATASNVAIDGSENVTSASWSDETQVVTAKMIQALPNHIVYKNDGETVSRDVVSRGLTTLPPGLYAVRSTIGDDWEYRISLRYDFYNENEAYRTDTGMYIGSSFWGDNGLYYQKQSGGTWSDLRTIFDTGNCPVLSSNGIYYATFPNGLCLQWGESQLHGAGEADIAIYFPIAFLTTPTIIPFIDDYNGELYIYEKTTSYFMPSINNSGSSTTLYNFSWIAIGKV